MSSGTYVLAKVSIHAPLARSNGNFLCNLLTMYVSIHAPLARSNSGAPRRLQGGICFNTCSSCEEQHDKSPDAETAGVFQYMLLLRGATGVI